MRRFARPLTSVAAALLLAACSARHPPAVDEATAAVAAVLDDWHAAASVADEERYFGHLAAAAVFLGTDPGERWTVGEFRAYAHPHFAAGKGWTYVPSERHVVLSRDGATAWFDERLTNEKYGALRGTGVLSRHGGEWRISLYSMTFTVPNDATADVVRAIGATTGNAP